MSKVTILTDEEVILAGYDSGDPDGLLEFGRNVEQAVLRKLTTIDVSPVAWTVQSPDDARRNRITPAIVMDTKQELVDYLAGSEAVNHIIALVPASALVSVRESVREELARVYASIGCNDEPIEMADVFLEIRDLKSALAAERSKVDLLEDDLTEHRRVLINHLAVIDPLWNENAELKKQLKLEQTKLTYLVDVLENMRGFNIEEFETAKATIEKYGHVQESNNGELK